MKRHFFLALLVLFAVNLNAQDKKKEDSKKTRKKPMKTLLGKQQKAMKAYLLFMK